MANKKKLIDANALMKRFRIVAKSGGPVTYHVSDICAAIEDEAIEESVDAVEVVHGRWIEYEDMVESYLADCTEVFYECSACGVQQVIGKTPYCPNCGAKMDGGSHETD